MTFIFLLVFRLIFNTKSWGKLSNQYGKLHSDFATDFYYFLIFFLEGNWNFPLWTNALYHKRIHSMHFRGCWFPIQSFKGSLLPMWYFISPDNMAVNFLQRTAFAWSVHPHLTAVWTGFIHKTLQAEVGGWKGYHTSSVPAEIFLRSTSSKHLQKSLTDSYSKEA